MKRRLAVVFVLFIGFCRISFAQEEITIEQVIALALEKNYDVRIIKKSAESAQTDNRYAWGAFLPQLNGVGSTTATRNDQELRFVDEARNNSGINQSKGLNGAVQLNWTLFDGMAMFATRERIAALAEQGELLVKNQMINTIAITITSYYDIVRQKQQLKAIQEQMSVSEERVKLAERKLQVGTGIKPELLQARVDFNAQRTQVIQQESIIAQLKEQLNAMVGLQLPTVFEVADTILIDMNLQPEELSQNLENTNFSLLSTRQNIRIANTQLRESRATYLPTLNLNAAYTYSKIDILKNINFFSPIYNQSNGYNYGLSVAVPIFNSFNARRLSQQSKIELDRQHLIYDQLKIDVDVSLKNAFVSYDNARKILAIEEENIGLAKENVFIALEGFKRGVTTFIELRTAQQSLAEAYNSLITARYNTKLAETELLRLSGALLK